MKITKVLFLLGTIIAAANACFALGVSKWQTNGAVVTSPPGSTTQIYPKIVTDGRNGAIIVWEDQRDDIAGDVYVQRMDSLGNCLWAANGVPVAVGASRCQAKPEIVPDGDGGAIIAWWDAPVLMGLNWGYAYAQRVDSMGNCLWRTNGVPVCSLDAVHDMFGGNLAIAGDDAKGAIIAWRDVRSSDPWAPNIYAQRVDSLGICLWTLNGVPVAVKPSMQEEPGIVGDGAGGAIICWKDSTVSGGRDVYAQRVDANGIIRWSDGGIPICNADSEQVCGEIMKSEDNCAIISWSDNRNGNKDIYVQRVDTVGVVKWAVNGVPICEESSKQTGAWLTSDLKDGCIAVWIDHRNGDADLFAQRVDVNGNIRWAMNGIPLCIGPGPQWVTQICSDLAGGAIVVWQDTVAGNRNEWDIYCQRVDSTGNCLWGANGMAVCTQDSFQERPVVVSDGTIGGAIIVWQDARGGLNTWLDIYAQRVGDTLFTGAEGEPEGRIQKAEFKMCQNYPNPVRQFTTIGYQLPERARVELSVYNILGEKIKILADKLQEAGAHDVSWNSTDEKGQKVSSGVYIYRLQTGDFMETKKMVVIK
jgi:hypothetical protein